MSFVTGDGVRLNLDISGAGPDNGPDNWPDSVPDSAPDSAEKAASGGRPPVVLQHGLCGDRTQAAQVMPPGFDRLTLECRGHGLSDTGPPERLSLAQFTDDLAGMIAQRGICPVVGGISMGAAIAMRLAVLRPGLVRALVLARPAWGWAPAPANMAPNAEVGSMLAAGQSLADFDATETARRLAADAPDNLASLRGFFARQPLEVTAALLTRIAGDGPGVTRTDLAALRLPVLVIGHDRDHVHPLGLACDLARAIPGAQLARITPKADNPAAYRNDFRAALAAFLKGL